MTHDLLYSDGNNPDNNPADFFPVSLSFLGFDFSGAMLGSKPSEKIFSASFARLTGNFWWWMLGTIRLNFWMLLLMFSAFFSIFETFSSQVFWPFSERGAGPRLCLCFPSSFLSASV